GWGRRGGGGAGGAGGGGRGGGGERRQPAAALVGEVGEHAELLGAERRGLDAPQDDRAIGEQLLARLGEARHQLVGRGDAKPVVLVLGGPLEDDEVDVLVAFHRAVHELHLEPRLPFEIEDLLFAVADLDERV